MRIRSISRVLLAATPMVVGGMLASGSSALAQSKTGPARTQRSLAITRAVSQEGSSPLPLTRKDKLPA